MTGNVKITTGLLKLQVCDYEGALIELEITPDVARELFNELGRRLQGEETD